MHTTATAIGAVTAATSASTAHATAEEKSGELYELTIYTLKPEKLPLLDTYLEKALLPALKRLGAGPVGVFVDKNPDAFKLVMLTIWHSADQVISLPTRLTADKDYLTAAADYLKTPAADAIYKRIETSVLLPIEGMPRLAKTDPTQTRLFNLRIYQSHNERAAKKKIEMFNKAELAIFRRTGLTPVFFAETIIGTGMPNLTYMLVFPDDAARMAAWDKFKADPEWLKLKAMPEYADKEIVSHIDNYILTPTAYSQM